MKGNQYKHFSFTYTSLLENEQLNETSGVGKGIHPKVGTLLKN